MNETAMRDLLGAIAETLWPGGCADHEWDAHTLSEVARLMEPLRPLPPEDHTQ
jgi:hypothetical protein